MMVTFAANRYTKPAAQLAFGLRPAPGARVSMLQRRLRCEL